MFNKSEEDGQKEELVAACWPLLRFASHRLATLSLASVSTKARREIHRHSCSSSNTKESTHIHTQIQHLECISGFWWMVQNYWGVSQEHEKKGKEECANWLLSVVMDGSRIISPLRLLWGLLWSVLRKKYPMLFSFFFKLYTHTHTFARMSSCSHEKSLTTK